MYGRYNFAAYARGTVMRFADGRREGKMWLGTVGNAQGDSGYLYGEAKEGGFNMTGDDIAWVYPWYESALVGRWVV